MEASPETDHLLQLQLRARELAESQGVLRNRIGDFDYESLPASEWLANYRELRDEWRRILGDNRYEHSLDVWLPGDFHRAGDWCQDDDGRIWELEFSIDTNLHRWFECEPYIYQPRGREVPAPQDRMCKLNKRLDWYEFAYPSPHEGDYTRRRTGW